jgi:hypothetical protein
MTISQSRPGFRSVKKTVTMPPEGGDEGRIEVSLPPLEPILGTVQIQLDPIYRDAKITVTDDYGDEVWSGTVPADGRVEARMRIGTHRLEIEHPRYEKLTENVTVKEGMNTPFDEIHLSPKPGRLVLTGPPGAWVRFKRDGQVKRAERLDEKGTITVEGLAPGEYELVLKGDSGESETRTVTVRSAESVAVRFPR